MLQKRYTAFVIKSVFLDMWHPFSKQDISDRESILQTNVLIFGLGISSILCSQYEAKIHLF